MGLDGNFLEFLRSSQICLHSVAFVDVIPFPARVASPWGNLYKQGLLRARVPSLSNFLVHWWLGVKCPVLISDAGSIYRHIKRPLALHPLGLPGNSGSREVGLKGLATPFHLLPQSGPEFRLGRASRWLDSLRGRSVRSCKRPWCYLSWLGEDSDSFNFAAERRYASGQLLTLTFKKKKSKVRDGCGPQHNGHCMPLSVPLDAKVQGDTQASSGQ